MDCLRGRKQIVFMKLFATPLSHFARKSRILLDLYEVPYEFIDIGTVTQIEMSTYAKNPIMKVPILMDGKDWIIESDHISQYIVRKFDSSDRYQVQIKSLFDLNARAVMNGIMDSEVKIILARRTHVPVEQYVFFDKAFVAIKNGLSWLEESANNFTPHNPTYREFHLVCLWEHIEYYDLVPLEYKKLHKIVTEVSALPSIKKTAPLIVKPK